MNLPLETNGRIGKLGLSLAAAAAATFMLGTAHEAKADAIAFSHLGISNFTISDSGGTQYDASDFADLNVGNFTNASANLTGFAGISAQDPSDVPLQCLGAGCGGIGQNDFTQQAGGIFSRGDAQLSGALISGLPVANSATADTVAETRINANSASNTGVVGTGTEFEFALGSADSVTFEFDATPELYAELTGGTGQAFAGLGFTIQITDSQDQTVFTWAPDGILNLAAGEVSDPTSLNTSRTRNTAGVATYAPGTFSFAATSGVLNAGETYTLSILHSSDSSGNFAADAVPEPATLMMLGAGLLGLGAIGRRRKA